MVSENKGLENLKEAVNNSKTVVEAAVVEERKVYEVVKDAQGRSYATGKRKNSVARVWIKPGKGKYTINGRDIEKYFARATLRMLINRPFNIANREGQFDVECTVVGGGLSGQAGALKHGISIALTRQEPALRTVLKKEGMLTRDPRVVERKKYGMSGARKRFQFSKR